MQYILKSTKDIKAHCVQKAELFNVKALQLSSKGLSPFRNLIHNKQAGISH
jgi:hypothetical protein